MAAQPARSTTDRSPAGLLPSVVPPCGLPTAIAWVQDPGPHRTAWRLPTNDSWIAAFCPGREVPSLRTLQDYADLTDHEKPSNSSNEDTRRGMPRGTNHSPQEGTGDTEREQKAQVGRHEAPVITTSTGLRRRERRFESCQGHYA
jgi:hypothetical protein